MARTVDTSSTFETWRQNYNTLATEVGDPAALTTANKDSIVNAINYIMDQYFFFQDFDYDGSDGASSGGSARRLFSGVDNNGNTLQYMASKVLVYKTPSGETGARLLRNGTDYIAVDGTSVILTSTAATGDTIRISSYTGSYTATPAGQESLFHWQTAGSNIWNRNDGGVVIQSGREAGELVTVPTVANSIQLDGATYINGTITVSGNGTVGGTFGVTGAVTASNTLTVTSHLYMPDSAIIQMGVGSDLRLYHDGVDSFVANSTGALKLATETSGIAVTIGHTTSETTIADNLTVAGTLGVTGVATFSAAPVLPANTIDSDHYTDGSIDTAHYAANSVDATAINVSGNGTSGHALVTDGDGSFSYAAFSGSNTTYSTSWVDSGSDAILRLTPSAGGADDLTIVAGSGITITPSGDNLTVAATGATPTVVTVADESSDATCFPLFVTAATGDLAPKTGSNIAFNSSSGLLTATSFAGIGSALTDLNGSEIDTGTIAAARVATLNQDTTGTAAVATTVTITDNESTNESNALVFVSGANNTGGNLGLECDGDMRYNPSTGTLLAPNFSGTITTAAQASITSLGTLTTLTVDDITINGSTISDAGDFTLDVGGSMILDADGGNVILRDGGAQFGALTNTSGNLIIQSGSTTAITFSGAVATFAGIPVLPANTIDSDHYVDGSIDGPHLSGQAVTLAKIDTNLIQLSSESFVDNDTSLMTSAAIQDKILAYGYITAVGVAELSATGTASSSTFLRGDNTWSAAGTGTVDTANSPVDNDFAKFTDADTIEGRSYAETKTDLSLNNVENTAISTFAGSSNITTVGTISSGTWSGSIIAEAKLQNQSGTNTGDNATNSQYSGLVTNATHSGEVTGSGALTIADNVVDEANLKVSNSPTNGYVLSAQSGNTGGLTWAEASGAVSAIANFADNRVITASSSTALNGESGLTYNGSTLAVTGAITATDDVTAFSSSDMALKENIINIPNPLEMISKIGGYMFDWKDHGMEGVHGKGHDTGILAHEIEEILPEIVDTRTSGIKAVNYQKIIPLLIESIKELKTEVEFLKNSKS